MGQILEAELRLVGSDRTAAAFAGVIRHAQELQRTLAGAATFKLDDAGARERAAAIRQSTMALRAERIAASEVTRAYAAGNEALATRATLMQRMSQRFPVLAQAAGVGWMAGGLASGRIAHAIAHDTAEFAHQRAIMAATSGMTDQEIARADQQAILTRVPGFSPADNLKAIGELRIVFGDTAHAIEHLAAVQRATGIMRAINPHMNAEDESYNLARALELKGVSNDPEHFTRLSSMMVQAVNASRGKITGSEFLAFTQRAGTGTVRTLSDEFYTRVAPTLIQEMHGETAGRALATMRRALIGGHMEIKSAGEWMKLGLLDPNKVELDKIGHVKKIKPGALVDSELFVRDPYAWVQGYLAPALKKHGFTDDRRIAVELANLFSDRYAENMATILLTQKQRIDKDWELIDKAMGPEALDRLRREDPQFAAHDLAKSLEGLLSVLGSPLVGPAVMSMNKMADGARYLAERYAEYSKFSPEGAGIATGLGALGLGYLGFKGAQATWGLFTGAAAARGAAAAADAAAIWAGAAGRLGLTPTGPTSSVLAAPGSTAAAGAVAGGVLVGGAALSKAAADVVASNPDYFASDIGDFGFAANIMKASRQGWAREHLTDTNSAPFTLDSIRGALGGDGAIKAELTGSAEITNRIVVEPSPDFLTRIETMISNALHAISINGAPPTGTAGSTGPAMPEALPAGP